MQPVSNRGNKGGESLRRYMENLCYDQFVQVSGKQKIASKIISAYIFFNFCVSE